MGRKKRYRGHFCWACGRIRPNERFSGAGHKRHVCSDCNRLGPEELAYRQGVHDIESCRDFSGRIRRKQRKTFASFLEHENPRIREYAQQLKAKLEAESEEWRKMIEMEEAMNDLPSQESASSEAAWDDCDDSIPF